MWPRLVAALLVAAGPAAATGIEVTVAGEGGNGVIAIDLLEDVAPGHAERITSLAASGAYDNVAFHRVIDGFMAQTGDVQHGVLGDGYDARRAGTGASDMPDLAQEFSNVPFDAGIVGMARSSEVDSANSQFFIMFAPGYFLNNQYTVVGRVTSGQDVVDAIKKGHPRSGAITGAPDRIVSVTVTE
ncbi:MAG: peptidylprolyl isomerase [Pseudomonadota bacterium]